MSDSPLSLPSWLHKEHLAGASFLIESVLRAHSGFILGGKPVSSSVYSFPMFYVSSSDMSMYLSTQGSAPARGNWLTAGLHWLLVTTLPVPSVILPSTLTLASCAWRERMSQSLHV